MNKVFAIGLSLFLSAGNALAQSEDSAETAENSEAAEVVSSAEGRPEGQSLGLGMGVQFPGDLTQPNVVSARFRWRPSMTLEPSVTVQYQKISSEVAGTETDSTAFTFAVGAAARLLLASRGPIDVVGLGIPVLSFANQTDELDNSTKTLGLSANWGLGLEWWVKPQWSFSFNAQNPLLSYSRTTTETPDTTSSTFRFGAVWNPSIAFFTHIYY